MSDPKLVLDAKTVKVLLTALDTQIALSPRESKLTYGETSGARSLRRLIKDVTVK